MSHRIREAMRVLGVTPLGGERKIVESDETFIGRKPDERVRPGSGHMHQGCETWRRDAGGAEERDPRNFVNAHQFRLDAWQAKREVPIDQMDETVLAHDMDGRSGEPHGGSHAGQRGWATRLIGAQRHSAEHVGDNVRDARAASAALVRSEISRRSFSASAA
jgi:hypothetical protein